ncbi:MAG: hypothetical protein JKY88_12840 [Pseudomonadales bacterium]|nr:hypothetical protein [Pseudomonadales bacterium]
MIAFTGNDGANVELAIKARDHARLIKPRVRELKIHIHHHQFVILSPLAEGSDRLVAKLVMRVLNAPLQVPLPLPYDLYVADFRDNESIEEFKTLVGKAEYYYEMPMKFGNIRELAHIDYSEGNQARNHQYALVGAYVAQRSDELIALWDGLGGTAQIVR